MKKLFLLIISIFILLFAIQSIGFADDYTPPPGVLGPDEVDFEGKTVTFINEGYIFDPEDRRSYDFAVQRKEKAEELFNVKIEHFRRPGSYRRNTFLTRLMAGDSTYDIWNIPMRLGYFGLAADGFFYPVDEILPEEYFEQLPRMDQIAKEVGSYKGTKYSFGLMNYPVLDLMGIVYNRTLLEKENLPDISELYRNDKWTWDEFEAIAEEITADTNGDGKIDRWAITTQSWMQIEWYILHSNGAPFIAKDENGEFTFNWNSDAAIRAMNRMAEWYEKGYIHDRNEGSTNDALSQWAMSGLKDIGEPGDELVWVPMPKGPDTDSYHAPALHLPLSFIPANAEDPEALIALREYLLRIDDPYVDFNPEWFMRSRMPQKDSWENYSKACLEFNGGSMVEWGFGSKDIEFPDLYPVLTGEVAPSAYMDEEAPRVQAAINEFFGY